MAQRGSTGSLNLELVVKPPSFLRPSISPRLPIVLAVKTPPVKENGVGRSRVGDMSGVWALVSLLAENGSEVLVPPRTGLLTGRMVASIYVPSSQAEQNRQIVGYAHFPDLAITEVGSYRFRVSLIDMDSNGPSYGGSGQAGRNVRSIVSDVVRVHPNAAFEQPAAADIQLVNRLRSSGILRG